MILRKVTSNKSGGNIDPFALKKRIKVARSGFINRLFAAKKQISISGHSVAVQRTIFGSISKPVRHSLSAFAGLALEISDTGAKEPGGKAIFEYAIILHHDKPGLTFKLFSADNDLEVYGRWNTWTRELELPKVEFISKGKFKTIPTEKMGIVRGAPSPRCPSLLLASRKSTYLHFRQPASFSSMPIIIGTELIARR